MGILLTKDIQDALKMISVVRKRNQILKKQRKMKRKQTHGQKEKQRGYVLLDGLMDYGPAMRFKHKQT